ncbi:hypothetical protein RXV94_01865 [Yeosuana sp. MJ-SS3]|uniref:Uncharacterized protein n=1 Tax=Gilvirhabdus luticola TaxID=3079858 RepID=A0ABU3U3A7_9FLAO|nr:hypothetical protein [Yeosuana sp. MJ-SS3]MDU8884888.1 hypothetical protein [Yeosuana sp. MJ-SS3]
MSNLPIITLTRARHRNDNQIFIGFKHDWSLSFCFFFGWLSLNGHLSKVLEFATFALAYLSVLVWLMMYWKVWKLQLNK